MKNQPIRHTGRHFLQIPGPTNVPDRVLHAIAFPTIDHRGPEFAELGQEVVAGMQRVFQTAGTVVIYPSSGTGAWEAALVNTLSPGDRVLMVETGHFATLWRQMAARFGIEIDFVPGDWRRGADPLQIEAKLSEDKARAIKAVMVAPVEVSLCTTMTALMARALSPVSLASITPGSAPRRQSPGTKSTSMPKRPAIWRHRVAKWPVSTISTLSPGDSVLTIAASQAPVPDEGKITTGPAVWKIFWLPSSTVRPSSPNSALRWSMTGMSMARRTRSGTGLGPGI